MDSLAALMAGGQVEPDGEYILTITIGNSLEMKITVAPDDGQAPGTLFAYHVWNGATCLAEYFAANPTLVQGKSVVEFGAASALPSLVALHHGAKVAVMTDYPADVLLQNIRANVERNQALLNNGLPVVVGHLWGSDVTDVVVHSQHHTGDPSNPSPRFDVAIVAECLWMHREHHNLAKSIDECLAPNGTAFICFSHHVPGVEHCDLAFFDVVKARFPCSVVLAKTFNVQAVFNAAKTKQEFLYVITRLDTPADRT
ncbi:hypothetical protein H310_03497 [Aphanomyces invadans]|uniref:Uncharacterized protein n=1 Tax=Aphanomyces invadans TaxID=157072 RepID=A0A024UHP9_9STRA|nr:hypothetical protein H310_03497 [Aphanomyces invadans]ETW05819.1 hypothetical protein H310_03497 [Aphanomyces invadans]|eukprot:XP_008865596.1 hypothetical protein H310_03497 [Aphanomyces invadans]